MPEDLRVTDACPTFKKCDWKTPTSTDWNKYDPVPGVKAGNSDYLLRPEAIESVFVLYRITGNEEYREDAWRMFNAIMNSTSTEYGNSAVTHVDFPNEMQKRNSMESFWLAETLKYFYLIFSPPDFISLDEYVFNTEAHPFRLTRPAWVLYSRFDRKRYGVRRRILLLSKLLPAVTAERRCHGNDRRTSGPELRLAISRVIRNEHSQQVHNVRRNWFCQDLRVWFDLRIPSLFFIAQLDWRLIVRVASTMISSLWRFIAYVQNEYDWLCSAVQTNLYRVSDLVLALTFWSDAHDQLQSWGLGDVGGV